MHAFSSESYGNYGHVIYAVLGFFQIFMIVFIIFKLCSKFGGLNFLFVSQRFYFEILVWQCKRKIIYNINMASKITRNNLEIACHLFGYINIVLIIKNLLAKASGANSLYRTS